MTNVQMCCRDTIIYVIVDYMAHIGRLTDAVSLCEKLSQRHAYSPAVQYLMGNLYAAQGKYSRAVSSYENILKYRDNYRDALLRVHILKCLMLGDKK